MNLDKKGWDNSLSKIYDDHNGPQYRWADKVAFKNADKIGKSILDIGCGTGSITNTLAANHPEAKFFGIDISRSMIEVGNQNRLENCKFWASELYNISDGFDTITSFSAVHLIPNTQVFLEEVKHRVSPGGYFFGCFPFAKGNFYSCLSQTMSEYGLKFNKNKSILRTPTEFEEASKKSDWSKINVKTFNDIHIFYSRNDLEKWIYGTVSGAASIPAILRDDFSKSMTEMLLPKCKKIGTKPLLEMQVIEFSMQNV